MRNLKRKSKLAEKKSKSTSDINVTPLIDIVLVLLIVFIVMVPGLTKADNVIPPEVKVTPPDPNPPAVVVVTVQKDSTYLLQQDKVDLKTLREKLYDAIKLMRIDDRKVVLKVDGEAAFQGAVYALDTIRGAATQVRTEKGELVKDKDDPNPQFDVKIPITMKK
ncbi:MAG TPA: biopolymer transporter ExbD [Holophagaceae bacterium]|jgi:biopolymer transport protein TolR|nr:biopolymer transporter ExbD [Holophagaceae bacterium]